MKLFRRRKPSLNRMLGISNFKSKITRATGGRAARDPSSIFTNAKRRVKRSMGLESSYNLSKSGKTSKRKTSAPTITPLPESVLNTQQPSSSCLTWLLGITVILIAFGVYIWIAGS